MSLGAGLQAIRGFFVSVRAATARILVNVQVKHASFYDEGPLERVTVAYLGENGQSKVKLGNFLKKLSINVTHVVRKNKSGRQPRRIKIIVGLATIGRGLQHPPIVPDFGSGSKEVKFFLDDLEGGSAEKAQGPAGTSGKKGSESWP